MVKRCVSAPGVATKQIQPASEPFLRCRARAHISNLAIGGVNGRGAVPRRTAECVLCSRGSCVHRARVLKHPAPTRRQAGSHRGLPDAPVEPCVKTLGQRQRYHPRAPSLEGCVEVFGIISCFCASCVMMSSKVCFGSVCFSVTFRKGKLWL